MRTMYNTNFQKVESKARYYNFAALGLSSSFVFRW